MKPDFCGSCHADAEWQEFIGGVASQWSTLAFYILSPFSLVKDSSVSYLMDLNSPIALLELDKQVKFEQTFCEQQAFPSPVQT